MCIQFCYMQLRTALAQIYLLLFSKIIPILFVLYNTQTIRICLGFVPKFAFVLMLTWLWSIGLSDRVSNLLYFCLLFQQMQQTNILLRMMHRNVCVSKSFSQITVGIKGKQQMEMLCSIRMYVPSLCHYDVGNFGTVC